MMNEQKFPFFLIIEFIFILIMGTSSYLGSLLKPFHYEKYIFLEAMKEYIVKVTTVTLFKLFFIFKKYL